MLFQETAQQIEIVGRVADFCPICRDLRPFTFRKEFTVRVQIVIHCVPHVHELDSKEAGWDRVCETCNIDLPAFPSMYSSISPDRTAGLEELIRDTNPHLRKKVEARLAVEEQVRASALAPDRRRDLLLEPFYLLEHRIRLAMGNPPNVFHRWVVPLSGVLAIMGFFVTALLPEDLHGRAWSICITVLLMSIFLLLRRGLRFLNRKSIVARVIRLEVHPLLGRALKPLNPSSGELSELLLELREQHKNIGGLVRSDAILSEMACIK